MAIKLNDVCLSHAMHLAQTGKVSHGKVNADLIGKNEKNKDKFLGVDDAFKPDEAGHWKYPVVGNDGAVNRKLLGLAQGYAEKNGDNAVADAAKKIATEADKVPDHRSSHMGFEHRLLPMEFRMEEGSDGSLNLVGRAACYNSPSEPLPLDDDDVDDEDFREVIMPGAFTRTLGTGPDVRLLINHDGIPLARTTSGTLSLSEDEAGLMCRAPNLDRSNPKVQEIASALNRGDVDQMSFGFRCISQNWRRDDTGQLIRELRDVEIHDGDVSVVTYPAYKATSAGLRNLDAAKQSYHEFRSREAQPAKPAKGMSVGLAKAIMDLMDL
jgi:hypothetical protein